MSFSALDPQQLRLNIDPASLAFVDTSQLVGQPLPWIGQQRAEQAARFGLHLHEEHANLFVIDEVGSGCGSLLHDMAREVASRLPTPPDLCLLLNGETCPRPLVLRLPAGQGRLLQQAFVAMQHNLATAVPQELTALIDQQIDTLLAGFNLAVPQAEGLSTFLAQLRRQLSALPPTSNAAVQHGQTTVQEVLRRHQLLLAVDNSSLRGAPVMMEAHPCRLSLFGTVLMPLPSQTVVSPAIDAGSLLRADGGFLLLHLRDLFVDAPLLEQFYRWLRSGLVPIAQQAGEPGAASSSPLLVTSRVKILLFGTRAQYQDLQHSDPALLNHFQVLVDFSESFIATPASYQDTAVFIAHTCQQRNLPQCSAAAVARLLELSHRLAEDQRRQSALFSRFKTLLVESAAACQQRRGRLVEAADVEYGWQQRRRRHDYPQQRLCEAIADGEMLISVAGQQVGQVNGLTIIDLDENGFGLPVRVTARVHAGEEGLINIDHEVAMSGPIHDKGVLILHSYLAALFAHHAPLCFNASIVFEQEYNGIEGDSASCAELFALISALAGVPLHQGIAVTGALNQHGEMLPVGGINEKIEGYFRVCATMGLTGQQGVLLPGRNARHLMLDAEVVAAVEQGLFHLYAVDQAIDGLELLSGMPTGVANGGGNYPRASLLGCVQQTLLRYQRSCQAPQQRQRPG